MDLLGTNVAAPVRPYDTGCTYPTALADEIAGGLKYVDTESLLSQITPERRPVGTVVSVGIGRFKQWTGTAWQTILQGLDAPAVTCSVSEVALRFGETSVPLKPATANSAGCCSSAMFTRLMGHGKQHLQGGDDAMASTTATADRVPQADKFGKISGDWLPFGTATSPGIVRVADDGQSPSDELGIAVIRANDSRIAKIPGLVKQVEALSFPIRYVETLPSPVSVSSQTFYCIKNTGLLHLLIDGQWRSVGGGPRGESGLSAYEVAQLQGYTGSIDEWLDGLKGRDGDDGDHGKSAYELAHDAGFDGTLNVWLESLQGRDGESGQNGVNGKSAYQLAQNAGFIGTLEAWLTSLQGQNGEDGQDGNDGQSAYQLAQGAGFIGTLEEWLESLQGRNGENGQGGNDGKSAYQLAQETGFGGTLGAWLESLQGRDGENGEDGRSAYQLAQDTGFVGTLADWIASLKGERGDGGKSAYALATEKGFVGSVMDWLASLKGEPGEKGADGHGIRIIAYYDSLEVFDAEHPAGQDGDCYGVAGNLLIWAGDRWSTVGKLIGASAYEVWLEQPGNGDKTFDHFFQELAHRAFSNIDVDLLIQNNVAAWMTENIASVVQPLIESWLNLHLGPLLDLRLPSTLETSLNAHVTTYHEWQPM